MRISGAEATDLNAKVDANDSRKPDKDGNSSFAKVLSKKRQPDQDDAQLSSGKGSKSESTTATLLAEPDTQLSRLDAPAVEDKHLVNIPQQLQELVHEIAVVVNSPNQQQVHIELNSNILKGLHIRIDRQDGAVAIQFQSSSDEVAKLLSKNADTLADALVERGVTLKDIRVAGPEKTENRQDYKNRFGGRGAWQGSGRQGRR